MTPEPDADRLAIAELGATAEPPADPLAHPAPRLTAAVAAAGFVTFINLYPTQALLPTLGTAFGTSLARTGLTVTATLVAVACVAPFVGSLSDAWGRRRLVVGAALGATLPSLAAAAAPSLDVLIACRFLQGLLLPFIFTVTVAYIAEECPGPAGVRATATYAVGTIVGGFGGRFVAGWTAQLVSWRAAFLVLAALTLLGAAVVARLPPERRFRPARFTLRSFGDHISNDQVLATCAVGFAVLFSVVATFTYANVLLAAPPYRLGPGELGTIFATYLLGTVSTPIASRLTLRFGRRRTLHAGVASVAAGMLLLLAHPLPLLVAGLAFVAMGIFVQQVLSIGYVALAARAARSTAVGLYVTAYYVGGSLGGILPAWVYAHGGWPGCVLLVLLVQAAVLAITWLAWPRDPGLPSAPQPHLPR